MKKLGDLIVTTAAYGFMSADSERAIALFKSAYNGGVRFFDTADLYSKGDNERSLGRALRETATPRDQVVIATKGGCCFTDKGLEINNSEDYILSACDASLERLQFDYIDLYYIHRLADDANLDEIMRALKTLKIQGKIRHIGFSELTPDQIRIAVSKAAEYDLKIAAIENEISLWCYDESLIATCGELGVGVVAYSPLGRGFFSEQAREDFVDRMDAKDFRRTLPKFKTHFHENLQRRAALEKLAQKGVSQSQIASSLSELSLAWLSNLGDHVVAIPGTNSVAHLQENIQSACKLLGVREMRLVFEAMRESAFVGDRYPSRDQEMKSLVTAQESRPIFPSDSSFLGKQVGRPAAAVISDERLKAGFSNQ